MDKSIAIRIISKKGIPLNSKNVVFANINTRVPVWWLEPNNDKFKTDLYIALNCNINNILYVFFLPAGTFNNPKKIFYQRNDKNSSHIEIQVDGETFIDTKSKIDFSKFIIKKVMY